MTIDETYEADMVALEKIDKDHQSLINAAVGGVDAILSPVTGGMPFATIGINLLRAIPEARAKTFITTTLRELSINEEEFISQLENDEIKKEALYDYCEAVRKTSSKLSLTCLAIIYSRYHKRKGVIDPFTAHAVRAFDGILDRELELFLVLSDIEFFKELNDHDDGSKEEKGPVVITGADNFYPVVLPKKSTFGFIIDRLPFDADDEFVFQGIQNLIRREMLLEDCYVGRHNGNYMPFGIGENSRKYRELIMEAKDKYGRVDL